MRNDIFEIEMLRQLKQHEVNKLLKEHDTQFIKKYVRDNGLSTNDLLSNGIDGLLLDFLHFVRVMNKDMGPLNQMVHYIVGDIKNNFKMGMFYGYMLGSFLMFIFMLIISLN